MSMTDKDKAANFAFPGGANFAFPAQAMWKQSFFELPLTLMSESLRFTGARLEAQANLLSSLLNCRSMPEVMETQSEFVRKAVDDFNAETSRIMEDLRANIGKAA